MLRIICVCITSLHLSIQIYFIFMRVLQTLFFHFFSPSLFLSYITLVHIITCVIWKIKTKLRATTIEIITITWKWTEFTVRWCLFVFYFVFICFVFIFIDWSHNSTGFVILFKLHCICLTHFYLFGKHFYVQIINAGNGYM